MLGSAPAATPLSIVFICFVVLLKPQFVLLKIIDEGEFEGLDIAAVMPFVEEEDAGLLFKKALSGEYPNLNPMKIAPFVDEADLSFVVDAYIDGKLSEKMLDGLYPFLEDDDLKRLFKHILNQK